MKNGDQRVQRRQARIPRAVPQRVQVFLRNSIPRIVSAFPRVQRIILFGSYASGHPTRHSDVDLLIVMPTTQRWHDRIRHIHALFPERPVPLDVIVRTPQEVRQRLTSYFCPFTRDIVQKGRVLYEAAPRHS
jgi:predicted nucleotidyltransferase